jgi:hypothetical protein
MRRSLSMATSFVLLLFSSVPAQSDPVKSLLSYLPSAANGLAVVRVKEILDTPNGKREKWAERPGKFLAGAGTVPSWTEVLVMGASVHPGSERDNSSFAVLPLPDGITMESVAQHEDSPLQTISGLPAVLSKRNAYFVELAPGILGVQTPAMRQEVSRWARQAQRNETELSDFLAQAAASPDHIILALDMQDMLDPELVRRRLEATPSLKGQKEELVQGLAEAIAQLRGVTFTANLAETTKASITVDFARELPSDATWLATLFLDLLNDQRMALRDFEQAKVTLDGEQLVMTTELSDGCLRQIMLLVSSPFPDSSPPPSTPPSTPPQDKTTPRRPVETDQQATIRKNRRYYQAVNRALDDMQRNESWSLDYSQAGGWILRAAKKIDYLSISGIDPDLAAYGANVSSQLRSMAASMHGMIVDVDAQQARVNTGWAPGVQGGWQQGGGWGGGGWEGGGWSGGGWGGGWAAPYWRAGTNVSEVRRNQAEAISSGERDRTQILQSITDQRAQVRQLMQSRYGVDFDRRF